MTQKEQGMLRTQLPAKAFPISKLSPIGQMAYSHEDGYSVWDHLAKGGLTVPLWRTLNNLEQVGPGTVWTPLLTGTLGSLNQARPENRVEKR